MSAKTAFVLPDDEVAIQPTSEAIYWFNGRPTVEGKLAIGLHVPAGDAQLDALAERLSLESVTVIHSGNTRKPYYHLSPCSLIFIASNTQSPQDLRGTPRKGFAYSWGPVLDEKTGQFKRNDKGELTNACRVKVRVFIHELVRAGFCEPFQLALRGYITDSLMKTASAVYRLTRALTDYRQRHQSEEPAYFYGVSLPIAPAREPISVGEGGVIYPLRPDLPARLDDAFIEAHETPAELVTLIRESLLQQAVDWSTQESLLLRQGRHPEQLPRESGVLPAVAVSEVETESRDRSVEALPALVSPEEEEDAYAALFEEEEPPEWVKLGSLKEQFARLYPEFSRGPGWWATILRQALKDKWPEGTSISDADLTAQEIERLARFYEEIKIKLARKRAQARALPPARE